MRRIAAVALGLTVALGASPASAATVDVTVDPTPRPEPRLSVRLPDSIHIGHGYPGTDIRSDPFTVAVESNVSAEFHITSTALNGAGDVIPEQRLYASVDGADLAPADGLTVARFGASGGSASVRVVLVLRVPRDSAVGDYAGRFDVKGAAMDE